MNILSKTQNTGADDNIFIFQTHLIPVDNPLKLGE